MPTFLTTMLQAHATVDRSALLTDPSRSLRTVRLSIATCRQVWPLEGAANGDALPLPTLCWQPSAQQAEAMAARVWRWGGAATARAAAAWDQHAGETV